MAHTIHQEASHTVCFGEEGQKDMKLESSFWWFLTPFKTRSKMQLPPCPMRTFCPTCRVQSRVSCPSDTHEHYTAGPGERLLEMKISDNGRLVRHIWDGTETIKSIQRQHFLLWPIHFFLLPFVFLPLFIPDSLFETVKCCHATSYLAHSCFPAQVPPTINFTKE